MGHTKTIIIITGPTAVGKTSFAIEMARLLGTDIISADSRQCYRELNIGVAKPSPRELQEVKHYFIDSHSIREDVNAAAFEQYALAAATEIFNRHDVALMVGGTGLYIKAFCEGLDNIPPIDEATRKKIGKDYDENGLGWLQQQVRQSDPAFWEIAEQRNPQRLMRALEVKQSTGRSILEFRTGEKQARPFNIIKLGLELPREELYDRINRRVDQMMAEGLAGEVKGLLAYRDLNALQTVGYKEIFAWLDRESTLEATVEEIKKNSRHYAKRQFTWFKKDPAIRWYPPTVAAGVVLQEILRK